MEINGNTPLLTPSTSALPSPTTVGAVEPGFATGFQQILKEIKQEGERVSVKRGDTLVGIVREQQKKWNIPLTDREAYRQALALAKANGCRVSNGLGMLLYQGARALEIWSGHAAPLEVMRRALVPLERMLAIR